MKRLCGRATALALSWAILAGFTLAAEAEKKVIKEVASFGTLQAPKPEAARQQALDWLKSVGKTDAASQKAFDEIWDGNRPLLDKVARTLILGDAKAADLLNEARAVDAPAPTDVPALLKDLKLPAFYRANLALAYARYLCNRAIYDECISTLRLIKPEQTVDPAAYFFTRAVAEYTLMMKAEADTSILRLLDDVVDSPERYRMVAALMHFDMMTWQEKDLGWISRKMNVIKDRLGHARGGQKTQRMQKEVLVRLDEMIKELENQQKNQGQGGGNGGNCPSGGQGQSGPPSGSTPSGSPAADSGLPGGQNAGNIDPKRLKEIADAWGALPEKERARAMQELLPQLPPKYRDEIRKYIRAISDAEGSN